MVRSRPASALPARTALVVVVALPPLPLALSPPHFLPPVEPRAAAAALDSPLELLPRLALALTFLVVRELVVREEGPAGSALAFPATTRALLLSLLALLAEVAVVSVPVVEAEEEAEEDEDEDEDEEEAVPGLGLDPDLDLDGGMSTVSTLRSTTG